MQDNADNAYPLTVSACGVEFFVARTLDLCLRIETAFGAIEPLSRRLQQRAVPLREMAVLIDLMLADVPRREGRPSRNEIELWLFDYGIHRPSPLLANAVLQLIVGNDVLEKVIETKKAVPQAEGVVAPFVRAGASSGPTGS